MAYLQTDAINVPANEARIASFVWTKEQGATADADAIIDGGDCSESEAVTLTPEGNAGVLPCARNVTATSGGTAANIKAVRVKVYGKDLNGMPKTEELPAFTADSATTVVGSIAFTEVERVVVPAMDGAGVTVDVGFGDKYGIPFKLTANPLYLASVDGTTKTVTFNKASGEYTTITFATNPANKAAALMVVLN